MQLRRWTRSVVLMSDLLLKATASNDRGLRGQPLFFCDALAAPTLQGDRHGAGLRVEFMDAASIGQDFAPLWQPGLLNTCERARLASVWIALC